MRATGGAFCLDKKVRELGVAVTVTSRFMAKKAATAQAGGWIEEDILSAFGRDDKNYGYCFVENNDPTKNIYEDNLKCEDTETYDAWFYIR